MGTRGLLNLTLVVLAIGLGLIIYFEPGLEPGDVPQPLVRQLAPIDAIEIQIERVSREPLSFTKRDNYWQLVSSEIPLPAAEFQINALLRVLQTNALSSYPADSLDLPELGLQPPQATVTINDFKILFGITESLENRRYLQVDDTVFLVKDQYQHLINADWSNFVDRKLLPAGPSITRLQLPDLQLARGDNGQWQLSPEMPGISADVIQQLVDHWNTANALYVRRYDGTRLDETIRIETGDNTAALDFMITAHSPELVLARPELGIQYHLSSGMEEVLLTLQEVPAEQ
ncbi:MAG: DUF4340 domain-containing protein [Gammaproteobacteria bacterium]|nr:DUF4340 domain-containing protein [Gammaproteobacteria bacterium]